MNKNKVIYLLLALLCSITLLAGNAENVRVQQKGRDIVVTYDLSKNSNVSLWLTIANLNDFWELKAVEGAVGNRVNAGKYREIIWHPLEEYESFIVDNARFKIEATSLYKDYSRPKRLGGKTDIESFILAELAYSLSPQMSYGILFGQTYQKGLGWFVEARSNFHFLSATNGLSCTSGGYVRGVLPFYSGETQSNMHTVHAGFLLDILDAARVKLDNRFNTFGFYVGFGYGQRDLFWETLDGQLIKYAPTSHKGFSGNVGLFGSVYGLTFKVGVSTIEFQYAELEFGLGWMF